MILGLMLAAGLGSAEMAHVQKLETALGNLAYTVGACERALPGQAADATVLALTGADLESPSPEQRRYRSLFSGLFLQGRSSPVSGQLSAADCRQMIDETTGALHDAMADKSAL